ncbi:uncharacterized protein [Watersipora subatra]|uniref:uncharacterized protein n=1 Tax=Watersipora subatra TaxID=2589382 RepID=UPI00355B284E
MKVFKWVPAANQAPRELQKTANASQLNIDSTTEGKVESQPIAGVSSIPKRMLSYINDDNSMDSVASSNTSDNNDELSRDFQSYASDGSNCATNLNNSNSATPTLAMMQTGDSYLQESDDTSQSNTQIPSLDSQAGADN